MSKLTLPSFLVFVLLVAAVISAGGAAQQMPAAAPQVRSVAFTVADLPAARRFFVETLGFRPRGAEQKQSGANFAGLEGLAVASASARVQRLGLGKETIELVAFDQTGRPAPEDSRSDDAWFQHLALVTSDIDHAYQRVQSAGASAISEGPQTIPVSNPAAGGIRAYYFKGPSAHPLELIWYPVGKGAVGWHKRSPLLLGIDHTAISVSDTNRSLAFYRDLLGLHVAGESLNEGKEQAALSGVSGARVRITGLRGPTATGPGVELLEYLAPRRSRPAPNDSRANDLWHGEITIAVPDLDATVARARTANVRFVSDAVHVMTTAAVAGSAGKGERVIVVLDPDGHAIRLTGK